MINEKEVKEAMKKKLEVLANELKAISTGRANAEMLHGVKVEIGGALMPLKGVASITIPDARQIAVTPFDPSQVKDVMKGIEAANLGMNPQCQDGKTIRLNIPQMTEDRRKQLAKQCKEIGHKIKVQIQAVRADFRDKLKKDKETPEDMVKKLEKTIQQATDDCIKEVDVACEKKEKEILHV